jgi:hypothetical protein
MAHDLPTTTYKINRGKLDSEFLRNKLKLKSFEAKRSLFEKYPHVEKFFADKGIDLDKIREYSVKIMATGALTGSLLFTPPVVATGFPAVAEIVKNISETKDTETGANVSPQELIINILAKSLPVKTGPLDRSQEKYLEQMFKQIMGISTKANLEGEHLNTTYGLIGAEQHLMRYPGDVVSDMAPGKGAWGYFAPSKDKLTESDIEREKWYAVVQTLYLPDWKSRLAYLRDWYKYRKVLIVNTQNGNAVVADIADSGPAAWTGKHFGGSPEVMNYLGGSRYKKGPVLIFFVDDPQNKVALGPVDYNKVNSLGVTMTNV